MFFATADRKVSLTPVYMGFVVNEVAVVQYKLLQFFIIAEQ
jgi:hypothetical protein